MRTANYSDLRQNLKTYIDSVIEDSDTVIINRGGGAGVVLMSLDEYNSIKETEYFNKSVDKYINLTNRLLRRFYRGFSNDLENVRNSLLCVIILPNNPCQKQR